MQGQMWLTAKWRIGYGVLRTYAWEQVPVRGRPKARSPLPTPHTASHQAQR